MTSGPRRVDGAEADAAPLGVRPRSPEQARSDLHVPGPLPAAARAGRRDVRGPVPASRRGRVPAAPASAPTPAAPTPAAPAAAGGPVARRWGWRQRVRAERPHLYRVYRVGVGVVGGLLLLAWLLLSWLPGPGGIPLLLLALAVLSTEFRWARRLLERAREGAHRFAAWSAKKPLWVRVVGTTALVAFVLAAVLLGLAVAVGVPGWVPSGAAVQLDRLPGVDPTGG